MKGLPPQPATTCSGATSIPRVFENQAATGLPQARDPGGGRVAGVAGGDGADPRHPDVVGGGEVRLPDAEGDDVLPLGLEASDLGQDDEGVFRSPAPTRGG
jgi:hypothetical protein